MARNDAFDAFGASNAFDAFDAFDAFSAGGGGQTSGRLAEALTRSREGHLGRPSQGHINQPTFKFEPGLLRNWGRLHPILKMPLNGPRWLVRMDGKHRAQLCLAELMSGVACELRAFRADEPPPTLKLGSTHLNLVPPKRDAFVQQSLRVESWASLRSERAPEILAQIGSLHPFWSSVVNLDPDRTPWTNELMAVAVAFASNVVQLVKYQMVCPRPWEYSPRIQPMIEVPGHFAWPSGHATQAFMACELLCLLLWRDPLTSSNHRGETPKPAWREAHVQLLRQAERIATNRVIAGLHFPVDNDAGFVLGTLVAQHLVTAATGAPQSNTRAAGAPELGSCSDPTGGSDFAFTKQLLELTMAHQRVAPSAGKASPYQGAQIADPKTPLQWLWAQARAEWHDEGELRRAT